MLSSKRALFSLNRTATYVMSLVLLAILLSQLAGAENLDISGIMFLDTNSNGKYDLSDLPLSGYTIYIDKNDNSIFEPGEPNTSTNATGLYVFNKTPKEGSVRELVLPGYSFQPFSPPGFSYNLSGFDAALKDSLNFGNVLMEAHNDNSYWRAHLWDFIFWSALIILLGGGIILFLGLLKLEDITKKNLKENNAILQIVFGFILLFFGLYLWIVLLQQSGNTIGVAAFGSSGSLSIVLPVILALLVFGAVLLMLYAHFNMRANEPGEMRKTIAGLLVLGLVAVVFFALSGRIPTDSKEIITQYIQLVGIIVAFYFGSKAVSDTYKKPEEAVDIQKDLVNLKYAYDAKNGEFRIDGTNDKLLNFDLERVVIRDSDGKELANIDAKSIPSEGKVLLDLHLKLDEGLKSKLEELRNADPECNIEFKTSLGSNKSRQKIKFEGPRGAIECALPISSPVSSAASNLKNAKAILDQATQQIVSAKSRLTGSTVDEQNAKTELDRATDSIGNAKTELENATNEIKKTEAKFDQGTINAISELDNTSQIVDNTIKELESTTKEVSEDVKEAKTRLDDAVKTLKEAKSKLDTAIHEKNK